MVVTYAYPADLQNFMRLWALFQAVGGEECLAYQAVLAEQQLALALLIIPS